MPMAAGGGLRRAQRQPVSWATLACRGQGSGCVLVLVCESQNRRELEAVDRPVAAGTQSAGASDRCTKDQRASLNEVRFFLGRSGWRCCCWHDDARFRLVLVFRCFGRVSCIGRDATGWKLPSVVTTPAPLGLRVRAQLPGLSIVEVRAARLAATTVRACLVPDLAPPLVH
jgi:hypothetical protein